LEKGNWIWNGYKKDRRLGEERRGEERRGQERTGEELFPGWRDLLGWIG